MKVQLATDPPISFSHDVAVVGSSEDILNSSYGPGIDTHQEVMDSRLETSNPNPSLSIAFPVVFLYLFENLLNELANFRGLLIQNTSVFGLASKVAGCYFEGLE